MWGNLNDENKYTFHDPTQLSGWLKALLWAVIASALITIVVLSLQYPFLEKIEAGGIASQSVMLASEVLEITNGMTVLLSISAFIVYLVWVYRTSANIHALGASELFVTPSFAVGAYLIPLFNLYAPPIIMGEVWKASTNASQWREQSGTMLIALWWTLTIAMSIGAGITYIASNASYDAASLKLFTLWLIGCGILDILLRLTLIALVARISKRQQMQISAQREVPVAV